VHVEPDPIFVRDGPVWTSVGVTAGIDLALALVEEDPGRSTALAVARYLVVPALRSGEETKSLLQDSRTSIRVRRCRSGQRRLRSRIVSPRSRPR